MKTAHLFLKRYSWIVILLLICTNILIFTPLFFIRSTISSANSLAQKDFTGLKKYYQHLAKEKGAVTAFTALKSDTLSPLIDIHLLAHVIGDELYKQQGVKGMEVCTDDFRNACSHTIVINHFYLHGEKALNEIAAVCRKAPGGKGAYTMCFHGLGHGVLAYTDYSLEKAVPICKKTGTKAYNFREYPECVGGIIMELIGGGFHDQETWKRQSQHYLSIEKPLSPCDTPLIPEEAKPMCYLYLTPHLFTTAGVNLGDPTLASFSPAFSFCDSIAKKDTASISTCYGGFGKEFVVLARKRDIRDIGSMTREELQLVVTWCHEAGNEQGEKDCLFNALSSLYWGGENEPAAGLTFCTLIPTEYKNTCYDELQGTAASSAPKEAQKKLCQIIPSTYKDACEKRMKL